MQKLAIALAILLMAGCGIFRKKEKQKNLLQVDSTVRTTEQTQLKTVEDYRSFERYWHFPNGAKVEVPATMDLSAWINATGAMADANQALQDTARNNRLKLPAGTTYGEKWTKGNKQTEEVSSKTADAGLHIDKKDVVTVTQGNPDTFKYMVIGGVVVVVFALLFIFLKFRKP